MQLQRFTVNLEDTNSDMKIMNRKISATAGGLAIAGWILAILLFLIYLGFYFYIIKLPVGN